MAFPTREQFQFSRLRRLLRRRVACVGRLCYTRACEGDSLLNRAKAMMKQESIAEYLRSQMNPAQVKNLEQVQRVLEVPTPKPTVAELEEAENAERS
jgi:hypothetical protein